jgi:hypothetical protein
MVSIAGENMNDREKHRWRHIVAREFERPVKDLVLSFARDGYSKRLCAGAIGITRQTLTRFCVENGIEFPKQRDMREECKPKPGKRGYTNNPWGRYGRPKTEGINVDTR